MGTGGGEQTYVDVGELDRLAGELRAFAGSAMQSEAQTARSALGTEVPFGKQTGSGYVYEAMGLYRQNLVQVITTLA